MSIPSLNLPSPDLVLSEGYDAILTRLTNAFNAAAPAFSNFSEADPSALLLQIASYEFNNIREQLNTAYRQLLIAYAEGANLDNLVAQWGVTRQVIIPASGDTPAVLETDEALRTRALLVWHSLSASGTEGYYTYHALNTNLGVKNLIAKKIYAGWVNLYAQAYDGIEGNVGIDVGTYSQILNSGTLTDDDFKIDSTNETISVRPASSNEVPFKNHWSEEKKWKIGTWEFTLSGISESSGIYTATFTTTAGTALTDSARTGQVIHALSDAAPRFTDTKIAAIQAYLTDKKRRIVNDTLKMKTVGTVTYEITARITAEPTADAQAVLTVVKASVDNFTKDNEVIGRDLPLSAFYAAMQLPGVNAVDLTVTPTPPIVASTADSFDGANVPVVTGIPDITLA